MTSHSSPSAALAPLIVILGPTASGKSALGIALAERLGGEILVCDSTQVYRHFDIGTAKVPLKEQNSIPHHLVDLVEPDEIFTAGDYRREALAALADLRRRAKLPVITAGTGLYLRALLEGLADAPTRSEDLRARLRATAAKRGATHLHKILARLDRDYAARIAPRDTPKIIRAIEMRVLAGKPVAEIFRAGRREDAEVREEAAKREKVSPGEGVDAKPRRGADVKARRGVHVKPRQGVEVGVREKVGPRQGAYANALEGYSVVKIGLMPPRAALYARIDARAHAMLAAGWLDEVRSLVSSGIASDAKPFQFIGYSDLRAHLEGRLSLDAAIAQIQQATRRFAKRQLTWFRREPAVHWLDAFGDAAETTAAALDIVSM